jgi:hypothetical protein
VIRIRNSRFYAPIATVVIGTAIAGATAIGHTWGDALICEIVTFVVALGYFLLTGSDSDIGAIYGQRSDERQIMVRLRATRLAFVMMIGAAYVCAMISVALNESYWQAEVIGSVGGVAFLVSLVRLGVRGEHEPREYHGIMATRNMSEPIEDDDSADE